MKQKIDKREKTQQQKVAYKQTQHHFAAVSAAGIFLLCVIVGNTFAFCFEVVLLLKALCYPVYYTLYALLFTM